MIRSKEINKSFVKHDHGSSSFQIAAIIIASLGGFTSGALSSWSSPFMIKITEDKINYNITETEASFFAVLNTIGLVLTPFLAPLIDKLGRKNGIILTSFPYILSWTIKAFVTDIWGFYFARLVVGIGDAIIMCCEPMYVGEVSTPSVRGIWGNSFFILVIFGSFMINVVGIYLSVAVTSLIFTTLQVVFLILTLYIPESPYFYISVGKYDDARDSLRKLSGKENIEDEFRLIKIAINTQLLETSNWRDLIKKTVNFRALCIAIFLRLAQLFSGVFVFGSYTQYIFLKAGSNFSTESATLIYTALNFIIYSAGIYWSHKLGRRKSLMLSLIGTFIIFVLEAMYFFVEKNYSTVKFNWFPLVGLIMFLVLSSFGVGPLPALMQGEIFSTNIKSKALSSVVAFFGVISFAVNNLFYFLNKSFGLSGPFTMFAVSNLLSLIVTYFIIPETKGKTLDEVQRTLRKM